MCRMIPNIRGMTYRDQLKSLGLLSLKARRIRYQLITLYKMHKGLIKLDFDDMFQRNNNKITRGNDCSLLTKFANNNYRLNFFTVSSIILWNRLSQADIDADSVNDFKTKLSLFFIKADIW